MLTLKYPLHFEKDGDQILVTFPDFPYGVTYGDNEDDAIANAKDCLREVIASLMSEKKIIPTPSPAYGRNTAKVDTLTSMKALLYMTLKKKKYTKASLARKLNWEYPQVERLFDLKHKSKVDQIEKAFDAMDTSMTIVIDD